MCTPENPTFTTYRKGFEGIKITWAWACHHDGLGQKISSVTKKTMNRLYVCTGRVFVSAMRIFHVIGFAM